MFTRPPGIVLPCSPTGFAIVNSLRMARIPAVVLGFHGTALEMVSRYPAKVPLRPEGDPDDAVLEALWSLRAGGGAIMPGKDSQVLFLLRHRRLLEPHFSLCLPSDEVAETLIDKAREAETVSGIGLAVPRTVARLPADPRDLVAELGTSILLKPRMPDAGFPAKVFLADSEGTLADLYRRLRPRLSELVAQTHVPGDPASLWICNCVFDARHELVSAFIYRKIRTQPLTNGITTVALSRWNPEILERIRVFGKKLRYTGPADLEFKRDPSGEYHYIETNTRFTLSCEFSARCGVNQVRDAYTVAIGGDTGPGFSVQREGVYYLNALADIRARRAAGHAWARILRGMLELVPRRRVGLVPFSIRDPLPFALDRWNLSRRVILFLPRRGLRVAARLGFFGARKPRARRQAG